MEKSEVFSTLIKHLRGESKSVVKPSREPLWMERGWQKTPGGNNMFGTYRTRRSGFEGEIVLKNGDAVSGPSFYVYDPPVGVLTSAHAMCWRKRGKGRYWVHFNNEASIDSGISAIESQLSRFA